VSGYIVCGFYTPDYQGWFDKLRSSLDVYKQPHDFVVVPKVQGGWEVNTLTKASHILEAMDRHPDKVVIWLDVDCTVHGDLAPLAEHSGDVGLHYFIKRRKGRALMMRLQSNTMVFKPTKAARRLVEAWRAHSLQATVGEDDEATLTRAIVETADIPLSLIDRRWVTSPLRPHPEPVIVQSFASREAPKVRKVMRFIHRHLGIPAFARV
jgi:phage terminase large subunit-like protein